MLNQYLKIDPYLPLTRATKGTRKNLMRAKRRWASSHKLCLYEGNGGGRR